MLTRRSCSRCSPAAAADTAFAQGISSRGVKPQPRGKPSGLPFHARFTDVAAQAGLTHPVVYGGVDAKSYILEVVGCGVAFLDYDNDGWLDIFVLSGTRLEGAPPGATNRLYKNNRDGTFTDVTEKAGLTRTGWASASPSATTTTTASTICSSPTTGQNVLYRNNGDGTFTDVTAKAGLRQDAVRYGSGCTFVDYDRDGHLDLFVANYLDSTLETLPKPGRERRLQLEGRPGELRPARPAAGLRPALPQQRRRHVHRRQRGSPASQRRRARYPMTAVAADFDNDGWPDIYVACDSTPACCSATTTTAPSPRKAWSAAWR